MSWFRSAWHDEDRMTAAVLAALADLDGVTPVNVRFARVAKGAGALLGRVDLVRAEDFARVLVAAAEALGKDARRVGVHLTGRLPDGTVVQPLDLGLFPRPTGSQILKGLA